MNKYTKAMGYLIAINFEAAVLIFFAWKGGIWLNQTYPMRIDWLVLTIIGALFAIGALFWKLIRFVIKL